MCPWLRQGICIIPDSYLLGIFGKHPIFSIFKEAHSLEKEDDRITLFNEGMAICPSFLRTVLVYPCCTGVPSD